MTRAASILLAAALALLIAIAPAASAAPFDQAIGWLESQQAAAEGFETAFDSAYNESHQGIVSGTVEDVAQLAGSRSAVPFVSFDQSYANSYTGTVSGRWRNVATPSAHRVRVYAETDIEYLQGEFTLDSDGSWDSGTTTVDTGRKIAKLVDGGGNVVAVSGGRDEVVDAYEVRVFSRTDVDYLQQTVPLFSDGTWRTTHPVATGEKIARLVRKSDGRIVNSTEWAGSDGYLGLVRSFDIPQDDPDYGYEGDATKRSGYRLEQRSFVYDDALAVLAFDKAGRFPRAKAVLDALAAVQATDGSLPFSLDVFRGRVFEDYRRSGAIAWAGYAAVDYEEHTGDTSFRGFATKLADYLLTLQVTTANGFAPNDPRSGSVLGGRGRYDEDYDYVDEPVTYAATEHNVDAYFFLRDLAAVTGSSRYASAAHAVKQSLLAHHWNAAEGRFNQGVGDTAYALDTASWGGLFLLAVGERQRAAQSATYLETFRASGQPVALSADLDSYNQSYEGAAPFSGYKPYRAGPEYADPPDVVWSEGTWGALLFRKRMGEDVSADLDSMTRLQALDARGGLLQVTRGHRPFPYEFHVWPSVGGTAWAALADGDGSRLWRADAPDPSIAEPAESAVVGTATPRFTGAAGEAEGHDAHVTVRVFRSSGADWQLEHSAIAARAGAGWAHTSAPLRDGTYEVEVTQADRWGRGGTSARRRFHVATTPGVTVVQPAEGERVQSFEPVLAGTIGGDPGDAPKVSLTLLRTTDTGPFEQWSGEAPVENGRWRATPPKMPLGDYELTARLSDEAGTIGTTTRRFSLVPERRVLEAGDRTTDTDGDAIPDWYELNPYDHDRDGKADIDLKSMGADPNRADVFIQLDQMPDHDISIWANEVQNVFEQRHWRWGEEGIHVHVDAGPNSRMRNDGPVPEYWGKRSRAKTISHEVEFGKCVDANCNSYDWSRFDEVKAANLDPARRPFFHYALSVHTVGSSTALGGLARTGTGGGGIEGSDFMVSLGGCQDGTAKECGLSSFATGTFMHELGHNLGLRHGGWDDINGKPNYFSVMNYRYQGALPNGRVDFSHWTLPFLEEQMLAEPAGILSLPNEDATRWNSDFKEFEYECVPPGATAREKRKGNWPSVDWNCDGTVDTRNWVGHDINGDNSISTLYSANDWLSLDFGGGAIGQLGGAAPKQPRRTEMKEPPMEQVLESLRHQRGDTKRPKVTLSVARAGRGRLRIKVTASDAAALGHLSVQVDRGRLKTFRAPGKRKLAKTLTVKVKRGTHAVRAVALDAVGLQSREARRRITSP